jgi:hypothetical protein
MGGPGRSTNVVFHALDRAFGVRRAIIERPVARGDLLKSRVKRMGWRKVAGQILFRGLVVPPLRARSAGRIQEILATAGLRDDPIPMERLTRVDSVNDETTKRVLREISPTVVMINGTRIVKDDVLQSVDAKFVNIHVGITPSYRGVHGGYWALVEGDRTRCGVTVYVVDAGIDNFVTYPFLQLAAGVPLAIASVQKLLAGDPIPMLGPKGRSRLWTHPTIAEYLWNRLSLGVK